MVGSRRVTFEDFVERSSKIHNSKYDYSKVNWVNTRKYVDIVCPIHGVFTQKPFKHLQGQGCPKCAPNARVTQEEFVSRAKKKHKGKNYDYSKVVYRDMWTPVIIICPTHGEFSQSPAKHIKTGKNSKAQGCPKCRYIRQRKTLKNLYGVDNPMKKKEFVKSNWKSKKKNGTCSSSRPENKMFEELKNYFGENDVIRNYNNDVRYPFACDFYIVSLDLFIELNGIWFHGPHWFDETDPKDIEKLKTWETKANDGSKAYKQAITVWTKRDLLKRQTALKNNLNYLAFWDSNLNDFHKWFENYKNTKKTS